MERKQDKTWKAIQDNVSQGPIDNPSHGNNKALSQLKTIKKDAFTPKTPIAEDEEGNKYLTKWVFHPESMFRMGWDFLAMLLIIYISISVPFRICFDVAISGWWGYFEFLIAIIFMIDIAFSFNTGFYSRGALIMNRKEIAIFYLKGWFIADLASSIPYTWFTNGVFEQGDTSSSGGASYSQASRLLRFVKIFKFLRILRLVRIAKLKRILIKLEDYIASNTIATFFVFLRLLAVVFFIAHWTACWWYFLGAYNMSDHPQTWVTAAKIDNSPNFDKYITSLYWAFTTMTTVGYGDIVPLTVGEKIYAMFSMIVACGVFAYTVGSIGSLVSKQNAVENAYREQVVAVNRYMRKKDLPHDLQFRVRRYLEYIWENKKKNNLDEKQILSLLSEPLRDEIYAHIHGVIIKLCPIFEKYEAHFISQLTRALESETYAPGDTVIEEGEMSSKMYFIQNGRVDIYHHQTKSTFKELGPGEYFGEIAFFTEKPRCASAKCLDFVDLLSLSRTNMNMLLEKFPEAKDSTEAMSKKCEDGDYSSLLVKCYICHELGHVSVRCKKILLNLDHEETKKKWLEKRGAPETKYVNAHEDAEPNYHRVPKGMGSIHYNSRNIVGVPRPTIKMFPKDPQMYPKIKGYLEKYIQGPNGASSSSTSANSGYENQQPGNESFARKAQPRYTMFYLDSEGNEDREDIEEEDEEEQARSKKFRMSLVDQGKFPDPQPEQQQEKIEPKIVTQEEPIPPKKASNKILPLIEFPSTEETPMNRMPANTPESQLSEEDE
ncbi:unnamed protein product [Blepharisma stoltei]|uniref:Cyclic nucleotide-binding domain-containing protein n=1 Tax=Blepharisma stoltei TaxID=1481888 RepID=A0AAU9IWL6_9CILI|nr:unnamed protein product [Blepharisma stoltei]